MSWAFITALKKNPQQSYVQLLNSIRDELQTKYTQKPQLSCSHPLSQFTPLSPCCNQKSCSPPRAVNKLTTDSTSHRHKPLVRNVNTIRILL